MSVYFLLCMEDGESAGHAKVELFPDKELARQRMEAVYTETIQRLNFDTAAFTEQHYCGCNAFCAIIVDGEEQYSWSIGKREPTESTDSPVSHKVS